MNTDLFEKANRLNETLFTQFTKATEIQMEAFRRYADVAMEQARKVSEVRDLDGLKQVTSEQAETLKSLSEQFTSDWKTWQDYLNETREQVQQVFASDVTEPAKEKASANKASGNKTTA
ncbi:phasin family protein [Marinobacter sp.]|uniref:phasin family protein n=1 Tax=Marinobacter sp. TaxID=50741 RepID=UPI001A0F6E1B|nr:phasin family protein [Marinobacter sp.]MBE0484588.1 phasin family protein [Marinobacter sp.]